MKILIMILTVLLTMSLMACGNPLVQGKQGVPGVAGSSPTLNLEPATAQECPTGGTVVTSGSQVAVICNGAVGQTGSTGATGETGSQGPAGVDITPVTTIQFCPNVTPIYPSNFPEYGLCIGGNLYGVYSANDGFLALLPPGQYSSDGINASCTFTVGANCAVSY